MSAGPSGVSYRMEVVENAEETTTDDDDDVGGMQGDGKDDASVKTENVKKLVQFSQKLREVAKQCASVDFMQCTYEVRREFVLTGRPKVKDLYEFFPALSDIQEIIMEYDRIHLPVKAYDNFKKNLDLYKEVIIEYTPDLNPVKEVILKNLEHCKTKEEMQYVKTAGAMLLLPSLMYDSVDNYIAFDGKPCLWYYPFLVCDSSVEESMRMNMDVQFQLYVDHFKLCRTNKLVDAFFVLFASYYVFFISYPEQCEDTMDIMERTFLEINPEMVEPSHRVKEIDLFLKCLVAE